MKYSLVLHANGPEPKDYNAYLSTAKTIQDTGSWFRIGRLQSISFMANARDIIPSIQGGFIGVDIKKCEEPDLSEGINVFYSEFAFVDELQTHSSFNIIVRKGYQPLGFIQKILFDVDVTGYAKLYLEVIDKVEWADDLPKWIDLKLIKLAQDDSEPGDDNG